MNCAHLLAAVGVEVVPDQDDRGVQGAVRGGDQGGVVGLGHAGPVCPCGGGGRGRGRRTGPAGRASGRPCPRPTGGRRCRRPGSRGCGRGAPRCGPYRAAATARPRPRSRSTRRSPPLASCLGPGHRPPLRDRGLVALHRPVNRDLGRVADPVQQERHPAQRVRDPEQAGGQRRGAGQGPPLVLGPSRERPGRPPARRAAPRAAPRPAGTGSRPALSRPGPPARRPARRGATGTPTSC